MIKLIYIKDGKGLIETDIKNIPKIVIEEKPKLLWLDITIEKDGLTTDEIFILTDCFRFHELSIEDCLIPQYHPKVEEFEEYVFVAIHGVNGMLKDFSEFEDKIFELDMFIGKNYIVTLHSDEISVIESIYEKAKIRPLVELRTLENLLYTIFQRTINSFEFIINKIGTKIDGIEDKILENPSKELMDEIFSANKILVNLRKIIDPQRSVYLYFARETSVIISKKFLAYFRDIIFQINRMHQSIDSYGQVMGSILEVYVSSMTLKLNETMKFLTILATVAIPSVAVASYYGMNVVFPEHNIFGEKHVWHFAISIIVLSTIAIYIYLKKKKWL
ncbi:MAG: magnesium transporter CorA family protein [Elusimicrobiota bacterium]